MYAMKQPTPSSSIRPMPLPTGAGRCAYGGVSFDMPPQESVESVIVAFRTASGAQHPAASVSVTRERMREGDTLRTHTDRLLSRLGREADAFDLVESRPLEVGGRAAWLLHFTWMNERLGPMAQTMVLVDPWDDLEHKVLLFTAVGPHELAGETRRAFDQLLTTV